MVNAILINHFRMTKESAMLEGNGLIINFTSLLVVFGIYSRVMNSQNFLSHRAAPQ